jgi:hypothetical protein
VQAVESYNRQHVQGETPVHPHPTASHAQAVGPAAGVSSTNTLRATRNPVQAPAGMRTRGRNKQHGGAWLQARKQLSDVSPWQSADTALCWSTAESAQAAELQCMAAVLGTSRKPVLQQSCTTRCPQLAHKGPAMC